jgi:hypothetical protein
MTGATGLVIARIILAAPALHGNGHDHLVVTLQTNRSLRAS